MRDPAVGPRYFYPWNPLQLSTEVDNGLRVHKQSVALPLLRTHKRLVGWHALRDTTWGILHGADAEGLQRRNELLELMTQGLQHKVTAGSATLEIFVFQEEDEAEAPLETLTSLAQRLDDEHPWVYHHPWPEDFPLLLSSLEDHAEELQASTDALGVVESPNQRVTILALCLTDTQVRELVAQGHLERLRFVLLKLARLRTYGGIVAPSASFWSEEFLRSLSWTVYLGEDNGYFLSEVLEPSWKEETDTPSMVRIGTLRDACEESLVPLYPREFTASPWWEARQQAREEEEALYREFLRGLGRD